MPTRGVMEPLTTLILPPLTQQLVQHQQHRTAVDSAAEQHADGFDGRNVVEPGVTSRLQLLDVMPTDDFDISRQTICDRGEETLHLRGGGRTTQQIQFQQVVSGHHPGQGRVKRLIQPLQC